MSAATKDYSLKANIFKGRASVGFALFLLGMPAASRASAQDAVVVRVQAPVQHLVPPVDEDQQAKSEAEDAKREVEQEKREAERERTDQLYEFYDQAREALDDGQFEQAAKKFAEVARMNTPLTDAALYWKAYAENKTGKRATALATVADLKKRFPQSKWLKDADALVLEVRQSSGQPPSPDKESDEDLKLLAIQSLMNSDPERAVPLLQKVLNGSASPRLKSKALFVLAQSGSPQAMGILGSIASGQSDPELQRKAVEYLGIFGGNRGATSILVKVYTTVNVDVSVKRAVLKSLMISGNKGALFDAAKNEKNQDLKREAIQQLGLVGGQAELEQLYRSETSTEVRRDILQSFFLAGDSQRLVQAALNEKDIELRRAAIRNLGLMGASDTLQSIYAKESDRGLKEEVLNAYFIGGNAKALVAIAKTEKDLHLKKTAVEKLSLMGSKEGNDYLMELLDK